MPAWARSNQDQNIWRETLEAYLILAMTPVASRRLNQVENLEFAFATAPADETRLKAPLAEQLLAFREFGEATRCFQTQTRSSSGASIEVPTYVNEFWTARQRAGSSLHEISYRACF